MEYLIASITSAIFGHVGGRSESWWTGKNSIWGKLTGGGSDRPGNQDKANEISPLILLFGAYLILKK